ncbi:hypothetical protein H8U31_001377 [Salmonella enterica]|nr:hypothetical protein [Salmonella enterica]EFO7976556.1 hypothetical protein [Salmonella enterica]EGC0267626.1 hypothetical protein [Salmonella enterica]
MIDYFTLPELPDRPCFYCTRRNATLQVASCAMQWKQANSRARSECSHQCQTCPVGAVHAGEGELTMSHLRGKEICARCFRVGLRLISGDICVSCWNRQREYYLGVNARGKSPVNHPQIVSIRAAVFVGGEVKLIKRARAVSTEELIVAALRDNTRQVYFGLQLTGTNTDRRIPVQGELFDDERQPRA